MVEQHPGEAEKLERQLRELNLTGRDKPEEFDPDTVSAETERQFGEPWDMRRRARAVTSF